MARAIVNKLLHGPTARLKEAASTGDPSLPGAAAQLFGLEVDGTARAPESPSDAGRPQAEGRGDAPRAAASENR
jgi:glutamyl-tRNA reductase